jgi:hypothetical protein
MAGWPIARKLYPTPTTSTVWGSVDMSKEQYKKNAKDCRELARSMKRAADRAKLKQMAEAWEQLAVERKPGEGAPSDRI